MVTNSKFLGADGLTQTSANHIANIAKEMYESLETKMESLRLYNKDYTLAVNGTAYRIENESPKEDLAALADSLREVAALKSLIAWLREGIKAKQNLSADHMEEEFIQSLVTEGQKDLERPSNGDEPTFESVLEGMGQDIIAKYYTLEAKCATLGKFIHPDGSFSKARKEFYNVSKNPTSVNGKGRDAEIATLSTSFTAEEVDREFFELQKKYRSLQAELNKLKSEIDSKLLDERKAHLNTYMTAIREWEARKKEVLLDRSREVKALKIVIPQSLKEVFDKVNAVASAK